MIPYADFTYFAILLYPAALALVLGLLGRFSWRWIFIITVAMLVLQYQTVLPITPAAALPELWILSAFALLELVVARVFLALRARSERRAIFYSALVLSLAPLALAKFIPLFDPHSQFGFLGISYVTFRSVDVIIGIQDRLIPSLSTLQYLTFLFYFPTTSSGPIDRYRRFATDLKKTRTRAEFLHDLDHGVQRIFTGLLYKFILAYLVKTYWMDPVTFDADVMSVVSYTYGYSLYLFFDFAGYSAFAVGVSYIFGIHTPENFNRPFLAQNIREFWERWHITLSTFLRDHVYFRFVISATKGKWFKGKYTASYIGQLLLFGLMGLWHGTAWYYLVYGFYHGALMIATDVLDRINRVHHFWGEGLGWRTLSRVITFNLVCFGLLLFSGHIDTVFRDAHRYTGLFEFSDCETLHGWAWDTLHVNAPVSVDIYDGDARLATTTANIYRTDIKDLGVGNGVHAFSFTVPDNLKDGDTHQVHVKIADSVIELRNSPQSFKCEAP